MPKSHEECLEILEQLRWNGVPTCPYCGSMKSSPIKLEHRHHCRSCFTSYSVTVNTVFHKTHIDLSKWFNAITLIIDSSFSISIRKLAKELQVSNHSASSLKSKIIENFDKNETLFNDIKDIYIEQ